MGDSRSSFWKSYRPRVGPRVLRAPDRDALVAQLASLEAIASDGRFRESATAHARREIVRIERLLSGVGHG